MKVFTYRLPSQTKPSQAKYCLFVCLSVCLLCHVVAETCVGVFGQEDQILNGRIESAWPSG